jgi:hypothetical protein
MGVFRVKMSTNSAGSRSPTALLNVGSVLEQCGQPPMTSHIGGVSRGTEEGAMTIRIFAGRSFWARTRTAIPTPGSSEPSKMQTPRRRESGRAPSAQFAARPVSILEVDKESERRDARVEW